ncbi:MAG: hypothetical protein ACLUPF_04440 [Dorea sp.]
MLTINETVDKLYKQPERFEQCMDAGDYCRAKWCFISTVFVSSFIELDQEAENRLLGMFEEEKSKKSIWRKESRC